jgi:hypothetical protein
MLSEKAQATLLDIIDNKGGLKKGLPELFGYLVLLKEFKHTFSSNKSQYILFDSANKKFIQIPEIILTAK